MGKILNPKLKKKLRVQKCSDRCGQGLRLEQGNKIHLILVWNNMTLVVIRLKFSHPWQFLRNIIAVFGAFLSKKTVLFFKI